MKIIDYNEKYKKEIPELFTNTIHKTCQNDYTKEQLLAWANPEINYESWFKRVDKTKPYLVIQKEKLIGFVEFYDNYIDCFYIHHNYQGKGIGKVLLSYIIEQAKLKNLDFITVDASITAKPFFSSFGFKVTKENEVKRGNQILINYSMQLIIED